MGDWINKLWSPLNTRQQLKGFITKTYDMKQNDTMNFKIFLLNERI